MFFNFLKIPIKIQQSKGEKMKDLGVNIDKGKFANHIASKFDWFGENINDVFTDLKKCEEGEKYRRIDHILSDIRVEGKRIILLVQKGDYFIKDLKIYLPSMNMILMSKLENFFIIEEVDHF